MIYFFSNHKDTKPIEKITGEKCEIIPHPYIEPEWTEDEVIRRSRDVIDRAIQADSLVINGDYFLVSYIVLERRKLGKKTGFIAMKKFNEPSSEKDADGRIIHKNILKPIGIRWL